MNEVYEKYFDYGPSIKQEVRVEHKLIAAASGDEEFKGKITEANDSRLVVETENGSEYTLSPKWDALQVYSHGGRLGPVTEIHEL